MVVERVREKDSMRGREGNAPRGEGRQHEEERQREGKGRQCEGREWEGSVREREGKAA